MHISITAETRNPLDTLVVDDVPRRLSQALAEVSDQITHAEVELCHDPAATTDHLELRCMIEAHLRGRQPILVACHAASADSALAGAINSLLRVMESALSRRSYQRQRHHPRVLQTGDSPRGE